MKSEMTIGQIIESRRMLKSKIREALREFSEETGSLPRSVFVNFKEVHSLGRRESATVIESITVDLAL